jgi:hypothetical protein
MFGKHFRFLTVLSIAALGTTVAPASAASITTYTNLANWLAVSSGDQLIDFENGSLTNGFGVQFTGLGIGTIDTSITSWMNFGTVTAAFINPNSTPTPSIRILLPTPVTAFGLNLFSANPNGMGFTISLLSTPFTLATTNGSPNGTSTSTFFGVTSDTPFSIIDVALLGAPGGTYELVDNVRFGTAQLPADPTPEAATFLLIGSGLIGLMVLRKRMLKNKPALQTNPVLSAC